MLLPEQPVARKSRTKCRTGRRVCVGGSTPLSEYRLLQKAVHIGEFFA